MVIDIYKTTDDIYKMKNSLFLDGIIVVHGSRVAARKVMTELVDICNKENSEESYISLSYNHPNTELGYVFDSDKFSLDEAKSIALNNYNLLVT